MRSLSGLTLVAVGVVLLAVSVHAGHTGLRSFDYAHNGPDEVDEVEEARSTVLFKRTEKLNENISLQVAFNENKDGKLIVFLHGFPEGALVWEEVAKHFSDYSVAAPDQRGYHDSSKPDNVDAYQVNNLSADIYALVKRLNRARGDPAEKPFLLVAHDWGGLVAWNYAYRYPQTLAGFVVMNCPHPNRFQDLFKSDVESQNAASYLLKFLNMPNVMRRMMLMNDYYFLKKAYGGHLPSEGVVEDLKDSWGKSLKTQIDWYLANTKCDSTSYFNPCTWENMELKFDRLIIPRSVPTLFIWGEKDDMYLDKNCEGLGEYVKNLQVKRIPEAAHFPNVDSPEAVAKLIRGFISRIKY